MWEFHKDVYTLFVDFKKAYDSIHRESLINILRKFKFPKKLVNLVEASINGTKIKVKLANTLSQPVEVVTGLRQGDALSPVLFNLVLGKIVREINLCEGVELGRSTINILVYADDISLLGRSRDDNKNVGEMGIRYKNNSLKWKNTNLKEWTNSNTFKRKGSIITQDNDIKTEISMRLQSANKCFFGLSKIFRSRAISKNLKVRMYLTLLRPIVLYGAETWPLRKTEERRIAVFERKVLRRIYGAYFDVLTNEWRKLHNEELQSLFQRPDILKEIKKRRLVWAGHAWRKHDSLIRRVIEKNPVGRRPLGRPRLRWEDCVRRDTETVEPECHWQEVAEDRDRWQYVYLEDLIKGSWADEVENHIEKTTLPETKTEHIGNTKIITEYRWNKDNKKEKVVRMYKIEKRFVSKTVAERKTWLKFGDSRNDKPGPNIATTIPAEEILMQFLSGKDGENVEENILDRLKSTNMNIKCRTCGGEHWSFSCHLRDTGLIVEDKKLVQEKVAEPEKNTSTNRPYIPPSAREGAMDVAGKRDPYARTYDDVPAIRIENLSESTSETDLNELVSQFGPIARIFLASNKVTGECRGYAFVNFKSKMDAEKAIKSLHGYGYDHLILNVDWSTNSYKNA
ncbi:eIF3G, RNA recognition motif,RNA recognition motif domain,Eukaryotic translation initiation factor 3 [Cinara cedri]|uniref:Eukaryotic translation initiation factor 3 subunit G n=1 Tax=Cinara cedri TaxID=506608 RepID=A0A5E4MFL3_9HEMI|nr:eIF3G, RNA recognition motif,RNA recognition motif domain,Eukaryotic translation initiation factor 3 [Cinara cedri]